MPARFRCALVDDDRDFLELLQGVLAQSCPDLDVVLFSSGDDALAHLRTQRVHLVVTDVNMPGMSGLELTRAVRAFDRTIPILVVSATERSASALAAGADAFLSKDVFRRHHRAVIDELLLDQSRVSRR